MILVMLAQSSTGTRVAGKAAEEFGRMDPTGIAMAMIAMTVVFTALIFLYLTFKYIARLYNIDFRKKQVNKSDAQNSSAEYEEISGETLAAISLALHLYHAELQGLENAVITIKNAAKTYSPWSSKIYGLRKSPKSN